MSSNSNVDKQQANGSAPGVEPLNDSPVAGEADETRRLSDELQAANERALRAQAELENFRKRLRREAEEERRYAVLPLISELLPVIDNLERAIQSGEPSGQQSDELLRGVKMVHAQFLAVLERNHCRRLGVAGEVFDPHLHQAIAQEPGGDHPAGVVTRVARYGYQLHDRVVRPAEVLVSTGKTDSPADPSTS
jgi:molecular chaperone GrpE